MQIWFRMRHRRRVVVSTLAMCVMGLSVAAVPVSAAPQDGETGLTAVSEAASDRSDVAELSRRLRQVIRQVEASALPCDVRNRIVYRLRLVDGALQSGRHLGAAALLRAWIARAEAMAGAGTLSATTSDTLKERLSTIQDDVELGWSAKQRQTRRWPALPECDASAGVVGAEEAAAIWNPADALTVTTTLIKMIPEFGNLLAGLVTVLWPTDGSPDVSSIVDQAKLDVAMSDAEMSLQGMYKEINELYLPKFAAWHDACPGGEVGCGDITEIRGIWDDVTGDFLKLMPHLQHKTSTQDYRVELLPLYAQMENLYLAHLREGIMYREAWWPVDDSLPLDHPYNQQALANQQYPITQMQAELEQDDEYPNNPDYVDPSGVGYVDAVYQIGLADHPVSTDATGVDQAQWTVQNKYIRDNTLQVLDFRDVWQFFDPIAWPDGNPGLKLTRMIFSDPYGQAEPHGSEQFPTSGFNPPAYQADRLTRVQIWRDDNIFWLRDKPVVDSMRLTHGTVQGPMMGDTAPEPTDDLYDFDVTPDVYTADHWGPINKVRVGEGCCEPPEIAMEFVVGIQLYWAREGLPPVTIGSFSTDDSGGHIDAVRAEDFGYADEVLATARIMGMTKWRYDQESADAVVFGFRYDDSY